MSDFLYRSFASSEAMITAACNHISDAILSAVADKNMASLMLSGGSSPRPVYQALSQMDLPWDKVMIGLVDDRWVDHGEDGSNETFLKEALFQGYAKAATFVSLKTDDATPAAGLTASQEKLSRIEQPFDLCVMGMGLDGHTASWFPNSIGLEDALDPNNPNIVVAIDARGCPVAGSHPDRISLTLPAVMSSKQIVLIIPGTDKSNVFKASAEKSVYEAPVKALRAAGKRLTVLTDET